MMTLDERLHAIAALLPVSEKVRLTAPLRPGESIDDRLQAAAQSLAHSEGLVCSTPAELDRVKVSLKERAMQISQLTPHPEVPETEAKALAARLAACKTPQALTTFWRALTPAQRAVVGRTSR
jgi:hypothetical protein